MRLARLERVPLREVWPSEERDFTRWLAREDNLALLAEALGTDLELVETEATVGRFELDILAREVGSERPVVIENQIEPANHGHLGQLLAYAAGFDADMVVWVVGEPREEYRRALEWLNERTSQQTGFFMVVVELWRIGDSDPAPRFDVVVQPNEWAKLLRERKGDKGGLTESQLRQLAFWEAFNEWLRSRNPSARIYRPQPQHWRDLPLGTSQAYVSIGFLVKKKVLFVELNTWGNKPLYDALKRMPLKVELGEGEELSWYEARKARGFRIYRSVEDVFDPHAQEEHFAWLYSMSEKVRLAYTPVVKRLLEEIHQASAARGADEE